MPTIASSNVPTPKSWDEFEDILLSMSKLRWKSGDFYRNGRQGQRQDGVDVYGHDDGGRHLGVQGKNTVNGIDLKAVEAETAKAEKFDPRLEALYVATTAVRDAALQKAVRLLSKERTAAGKFPVFILFWDDVVQDLALSDDEFFKHYPQLKPKGDHAKDHDAKLFEELTGLLRADGVIHFLNETNMAFSFLRADIEPLREFSYSWGAVDHEFLHGPVEELRKKLHETAGTYLGILDTNTWVVDTNMKYASVPPEWEYKNPALFVEVVGKLHDMASEIVAIYEDLVRTAKAYLLN